MPRCSRAGISSAPASVASSPPRAASSDFLTRSGSATQNPAELLPNPKQASHLPRVLDRDQARELLERIPATTPLEARDRAMLELAYSCGLRCAELVGLDLDSIDFDSETVRVRGKGDKRADRAAR